MGTLDDACGLEPGGVCEWVYERTDGSETLAKLADWLVGRPLEIVFVVVVASIAARVARRWIRRVVHRFVVEETLASRQLRRLGMTPPSTRAAERPDEGTDEGADEGTDDGAGEKRAEKSAEAAEARAQARDGRRETRSLAIAAMLCSAVTGAIWLIALLSILGTLGVEIGPLIAGAGIAGIAIGFGAQSLVKDWITGIFMLIEDQYGIGDVIDVGGASGVVERIALRTTVLRSGDGTVWHVPNGEIRRVGNRSQVWSVAVIDVLVAHDSDITTARELLLEAATEVCAREAFADRVLEPPQVLGVESVTAEGITVRLTVKTTPGGQWDLQRAIRESVKAAFDRGGVRVPGPMSNVWAGATSAVPPSGSTHEAGGAPA
jgi:small-conductance mechanosensitive channel